MDLESKNFEMAKKLTLRNAKVVTNWHNEESMIAK